MLNTAPENAVVKITPTTGESLFTDFRIVVDDV